MRKRGLCRHAVTVCLSVTFVHSSDRFDPPLNWLRAPEAEYSDKGSGIAPVIQNEVFCDSDPDPGNA